MGHRGGNLQRKAVEWARVEYGIGKAQSAPSSLFMTQAMFRGPSFSTEAKNSSAFIYVVLNEIWFKNTAYKNSKILIATKGQTKHIWVQGT